jgi:KDO2-lipid IV(A) lauroyltransferase
MIDKIAYIFFISLLSILRFMPKVLRRGFFKLLAKLAYTFGKETNKTVKSNLDLVFGKKITDNQKDEICKYSYYNMLLWGQSLIEHLDKDPEEIKRNVEIEGLDIIENLLEENKRIIVISAHYGNIELLGYYMNKFVTPMIQVARASKNPLFDKFIVKSREITGARIVFRKGALKKLVKALSKNEVVSLIIDQHIRKENANEVVFLGKKAYQSSSSTNLARKFDAHIVPVAIFNLGEDKYKIKFYEQIEPIKTNNEKEDLNLLAQKQADALSNIILEDPKQWFWQHRRFKGFYNEIYK